MNKNEVISFFDKNAFVWDEQMIRNDKIIDMILENAGVSEGKDVLDVACGTGVLISDYLARNVASVTAVDISTEMVKIAKQKFQQQNVHIICGDIETIELPQKYDNIVVYNAFPHFAEPQVLIKRLVTLLKPGGMLTVAHGMSREQINACHAGAASHVSIGLLEIEELAAIFRQELEVVVQIADEQMYQVVGKKIEV
ncbi:MAG: class I SAM-dependent methyltransferase [Lachnospiraceae bacterium]|nr:class I SAM-dependent methyltransferase [Lachnospiraceae bacterium]